MFSFWSNDEDENSENSNESDGEKDKSKLLFCGLLNRRFFFNPLSILAGKPERFRYVSKRDDRNTNSSQMSDNVFQNNRSEKKFKEKRKQMDGNNTSS